MFTEKNKTFNVIVGYTFHRLIPTHVWTPTAAQQLASLSCRLFANVMTSILTECLTKILLAPYYRIVFEQTSFTNCNDLDPHSSLITLLSGGSLCGIFTVCSYLNLLNSIILKTVPLTETNQ